MNTAVVAGHICLDVIPRMPPVALQTVLVPGALVEIGSVLLATGGPVSNTGRNLHRLGIPTRLMGKVGDDRFGDIILGLIRDDDPALTEYMIRAPGETSSYTIVISPPGMDRFFMHCPGANHTFSAADVNYEVLREARLFHFGYPPFMRRMYVDEGAELIELYRRAKDTGVLTSLDLALPDPNGPSGQVNWRQILERTLPYVDFFLPSLDELLFMLRCDPDVSTVAAQALDMGAKVVVLKLGDRGLYVRTGPEGSPHAPEDLTWKNRELWVPCFVPDLLVGTTGAGDATIAGFLAAVLRDQPIETALTSAVGVGACNVEAADALSGVRSWEETQARIRAGWKRAELTIKIPGWHLDQQVWRGPNDR